MLLQAGEHFLQVHRLGQEGKPSGQSANAAAIQGGEAIHVPQKVTVYSNTRNAFCKY